MKIGPSLPLSLSIALRYLFSGRKRFAAFITWTSVIGLALGVIVLTVVISVMNGFDRELRTRLLGAVPHIFITASAERWAEQAPAAVSDLIQSSLASTAPNAAVYRFFDAQAMVTHRGVVTPLKVYGLPAPRLAEFGLLDPGLTRHSAAAADSTPEVYLGAPLAAHLGLRAGSGVTLIFAEPTRSGVRPQLRRFRLAGTFEIGAELDTSLALVDYAALGAADRQRLGQDGLRIQLPNPTQAATVAAELEALLPAFRVSNWTASYGEFFRAVALEKAMMFVVLLLVVAVATFNIVAGQLMVVREKQSDIAILRTMGATARTIRRAFTVQGVLIALLGICAGLVIGVWCAHNIGTLVGWLAQVTSYQLLAGTYFVELPSEVRAPDLLVIAVIAAVLALFAALIPAARAARINPVDGLH